MVDKTDKNTRNLEALLDELEETSPGSTFTTDANGPLPDAFFEWLARD